MTPPILSSMSEQEMNVSCAQPGAGAFAFYKLCDHLIDEAGYHWLSPKIGRSRSTDWMASIFSHGDEERRVELATGQASTMDEACALCVADYHERQKIEARKAELMEDPKVQEAMKLFKVEATGRAQN